jgi:sulfatase modifying factor 1
MAKLSRREFLGLTGIAASAAALGACAPRSIVVPVEATATPLGASTGALGPAGTSDMVLVEPGRFEMGSPTGEQDESPLHAVNITQAFTISPLPVTFDQYDEYCNATGTPAPDDGGWGRGDLPVSNLNWYEAIDYCNWLSERAGLVPCYRRTEQDTDCHFWANGYRLPTEAEWEYAARGGPISQGYLYAGSDDPDQVAWYGANSGGRPHPIGQKAPNELGLYDMSGNVWEFCWDLYAWNYYILLTPPDDPHGAGPVYHVNRSLRGGCFLSEADELRVANRGYDVPVQSGLYGIRLARTA